MRSSRHSADTLLFLAILGLTAFGMMMIGSASAVVAEAFRSDPFFFLKHQLFYGGTFGIAAFTLGFFVPYTTWKRFALPAIIISIFLLILVFVPSLQVISGGSSRWIGLGPITVQPTELTKLGFILYLAALLERKGDDVRDLHKSVMPFLIIVGVISALIIRQPDIGSLFTIAVIAMAMAFAGGFRIRHLAALTGLAAVAFAILASTAQYRLARIFVYLHPELDPKGMGYQINQSLLAVGSGGLWGLGFGKSRQKYHYLPEPAGDSIFAIMAEELGFIRTMLVLGIFALIVYKGYEIARTAPDTFGRLVATGVTTWILVQMFVNIGSILAITPLTGIPLPFISHGGSALVALLFASGLLLNISKYTTQES